MKEPTTDAYLAALEGIVLVPPSQGGERLSIPDAAQWLGCSLSTVASAIGAGLPTYEVDGQPTVEAADVANLGLAVGTGRSVAEVAQRHVMRYAAQDEEAYLAPRSWTLDLTCICPCGSEARWDVASPAVDERCRLGDWRMQEGSGSLTLQIEVQLTGHQKVVRSRALRTAFETMVRDIATDRLRYQWLTPALRQDATLTEQLGVVDCVVASRMLVDRLRQADIRARTRSVWALAVASIEHCWVEAQDDDGHWVVLDPVFAVLGARVRGEDPTESAFARRCAGLRSDRAMPWDQDGGEAVARHRCPTPSHESTSILTAGRSRHGDPVRA